MKSFAKVFWFLFSAVVLASCASNPYSKTNRAHKKQAKAFAKQLGQFPPRENDNDSAFNYGEYLVATTNFNLRQPNYVIIHHTAQGSVQQTLETFTLPRTQVSAHYVIGENGEVYQMLNNFFRAWHGGIGRWGNDSDLNSSSIGIELDNDGTEEFSEEQIESLLKVLEFLREEYKIPVRNFIGHSDIAPTRKVDPNPNFPWKELAEEGFGFWYDRDLLENLKMEREFFKPFPLNDRYKIDLDKRIPFLDRLIFPNVISNDFNVDLALRIIGYDISDPVAARKAFKLHFVQEDLEKPFDEYDLKVLYVIHKKYL